MRLPHFTVSFYADEIAALKKLAQRKDRPATHLIREMVRRHLCEQGLLADEISLAERPEEIRK